MMISWAGTNSVLEVVMAGERLLSEKQCKQAKPSSKMYYLTDGGVLRLRCRPDGGKTWMYRYYFYKITVIQ